MDHTFPWERKGVPKPHSPTKGVDVEGSEKLGCGGGWRGRGEIFGIGVLQGSGMLPPSVELR